MCLNFRTYIMFCTLHLPTSNVPKMTYYWHGRILFIYRKKLYKKGKQGIIQHKKNVQLYTLTRWVPNKSIQAVQLI